MNFKRFGAAVSALAVLAALGAGTVSAKGTAASGTSSTSGITQSQPDLKQHRGRRVFACGDFGAFKALAQLTGTTVDDLTTKYPQKTAWQIAKQLGKLDELKKTFLEQQKALFDKMAAAGKITADDSAKLYADLQKRVAAIDGVSTVTLGRPGYRPPAKSGR